MEYQTLKTLTGIMSLIVESLSSSNEKQVFALLLDAQGMLNGLMDKLRKERRSIETARTEAIDTVNKLWGVSPRDKEEAIKLINQGESIEKVVKAMTDIQDALAYLEALRYQKNS